MSDDHRRVGDWWLPENPETRVGGVLYVSSAEDCRVELTGMLYMPGERLVTSGVTAITEEDTNPLIVHGAAGGRFVTLLYPRATSTKQSYGADCANSAQILTPAAVIVGLHLREPDEELFDGLDVEIDNLTAWTGTSGVGARINDKMRVVGYDLEEPTEVQGMMDGKTVIIDWYLTRSVHIKRALDQNQVQATEKALLRVLSPNKSSWDSLHPTVKSMQDLLTLATRYPCAIRAKNLLINGGEGAGYRKFKLFYKGNIPPAEDRKVDSGNVLFTLNDLAFQGLLDRWGPLYRDTGLGIHVLFGMDYSSDGYLENRLFNAASAAESLHRVLFSEATGLPVDHYESIIEQIKAGLADREDLNWVRGRLRNDRGYKDRLLDLASVPDREAVSYLLTNVDIWAKWMRDARNALAHLDSMNLHRIPEDARHRLPYITSALMHLVLLERLGIPGDRQKFAVEHAYGFQARAFRVAVERAI
jgi:hypothetical protein